MQKEAVMACIKCYCGTFIGGTEEYRKLPYSGKLAPEPRFKLETS
jgi:hypothetical protein